MFNFGFLKNKGILRLELATFSVLIVGSLVYHYVEGWRWLDAIYFSVITLTTVGYGDLSPQTDWGKIFTIFYVLTGVGLMLSFITTFYKNRVQNIRGQNNSDGEEKK